MANKLLEAYQTEVIKNKCIIHRYERSARNKHTYRCIKPKCTHFTQDHLLLGKAAECGKCGVEFILTRMQLKNKLPVCLNCSKSPKKFVVEQMGDVMDEVLMEVTSREAQAQVDMFKGIVFKDEKENKDE